MRSAPLCLVSSLAVLAACVPATDEREPRGGVVARLVPSPATTGAPFASVDGWTVTIERFAVRAAVQAERESSDGYGYPAGGGYPRILVPSDACELKATAMFPGPASAYAELVPGFIGSGALQEESVCGLDAELRARFAREADGRDAAEERGPYDYRSGPSLVLLARAERGGRALRLELGLDASYYGPTRAGSVPVTIVANQGALVRIGVDAAALFLPPEGKGHRVRFDDVARADVNGDGVVTGDELDLVSPATCEPLDPEQEDPYPYPYPVPEPFPGERDRDDGGEPAGCGSLLSILTQTNAGTLFRSAP